MTLKLSQVDCTILRILQMRADLPLSELTRHSSLKAHTVRYALHRLLTRGVIRRGVFMDVYPLGYAHFGIFFSLGSRNVRSHARLMQYLLDSQHISFLSDLGGDFQYVLNICARDLFEVANFLEGLERQFGALIARKAIAMRTKLTEFPCKLLLGQDNAHAGIGWGGRISPSIELDELDHQILKSLSSSGFASGRQLARSLGVSAATVDYRVRRLTERGIISGHHYVLDSAALGIHSYLFLLYSRGLGRELAAKLTKFARNHTNIRCIVENVGEWDFELTVEVLDPRQVVHVAQEISEEFAEKIADIKILPVFGFRKISGYPFSENPTLSNSAIALRSPT